MVGQWVNIFFIIDLVERLILVEIKPCDVNLIKENSLNGCILEKDLKYPDQLHNLHNVYYKMQFTKF